MLFFFFQAEDGIRDKLVTGVQTCALPIFREVANLTRLAPAESDWQPLGSRRSRRRDLGTRGANRRSEERRVGKECRSRWSPDHEKKKVQIAHVATTDADIVGA